MLNERDSVMGVLTMREKTLSKNKLEPLLISRQEVCDLLGFGLVTLYRKKDDPTFPKPIKITSKKVAYSYEQIKEWVNKQTGF